MERQDSYIRGGSEASHYNHDCPSTPAGSVHRNHNNDSKMKMNDEDLIACQIEPPTFIIELNPRDQNSPKYNDLIHEIETSSTTFNFNDNKNKYYKNMYSKSYEEAKYYQPDYPMVDDNIPNYHNMPYDMGKDTEFLGRMGDPNLMQPAQSQFSLFEASMQKIQPPRHHMFDNITNPEEFINQIVGMSQLKSDKWTSLNEKTKEKQLKEFMMRFLAFQAIEVMKYSDAEKAFWDW